MMERRGGERVRDAIEVSTPSRAPPEDFVSHATSRRRHVKNDLIGNSCTSCRARPAVA